MTQGAPAGGQPASQPTANPSERETGAEQVTWDLAELDLVEPLRVAAIAADGADELHDLLRSQVATLGNDALRVALDRTEALSADVMRACQTARLRASVNTADPSAADAHREALIQAMRVHWTLRFVLVELAHLPAARRADIRSDPPLAIHLPLLEAIWAAAEHPDPSTHLGFYLTAEPEPPAGAAGLKKLDHRTARRLLVDLNDEPQHDQISLEEGLGLLESSAPGVRDLGAQLLSETLERRADRTASELDSLVAEEHTTDRPGGSARRPSAAPPVGAVFDPTEEAFLETVRRRAQLCRRYHHLKARLLGGAQLRYDRDRLAPVSSIFEPLPWDLARQIVIDGYTTLGPRVGEIAERFFTQRWIDARPGSDKEPHAFTIAVPGLHPFVMLSYHGTLRSLLTLAHELGQGLHLELAAGQLPSSSSPPSILSESISLLGEQLVLQRWRARQSEPRARLEILMTLLDSAFNMVFRHVVIARVLERLHASRGMGLSLSAELISNIWMSAHRELLGDSAELPDSFRCWWALVPHLSNLPASTVEHSLAYLIGQALHRRLGAEGAPLAERLVSMMAAGGSRPQAELAAMVGLDPADPGLWSGELDALGDSVAEAEELSQRGTASPGAVQA